MYASQPAARVFSWSSFIAIAVSAMIGMAAVAGFFFSRAVAAKPSMPGSWMSIRIRSGCSMGRSAGAVGRHDRGSSRRAQRQPDSEARALALRAGHGHGPPVQFRQQFDHRQAETGAFEFARQAAVDLTEGLEQFRHVFLRDA